MCPSPPAPPQGPPDSSTTLSPAERAFAAFLAEVEAAHLAEAPAPEFEDVCVAHPALAADLRALYERWLGFERALQQAQEAEASGDLERGTPAPPLTPARRQPGRYDARGELGRGGMGRVVEVWDLELRRASAMKLLLPRGRRDPRSLARFLHEARVTAQLEHPGVVPVHELGLDEEGRVYFTMPLVRGTDLGAVIARARGGDRAWSQARVLEVLVRVCETLAFAHARGVVHRDVKPANVRVGDFGEVFVLDWGLAGTTGDEGPLPGLSGPGGGEQDGGPATVTRDGDVLGTPAYMAPEQARGEADRVGPAADVYGVGALLYELLAGAAPYRAAAPGRGRPPSSADVLAAVRAGPPRPLHLLAPDAPLELLAICERAMRREPRDRYASATALAADLRAFLDGRVVRAHQTGAWPELLKWTRRNRGLAAGLGIGLLGLVSAVGVGGVLLLHARASESEARFQEDRADASAALLAEELRASRLDRARLEGASGRLREAAALLWPLHLERPEDALTLWRLRELYARFPLVDGLPVPDWPHALAVGGGGRVAVVVGSAGPGEPASALLLETAPLRLRATLPLDATTYVAAVDRLGKRSVLAGAAGSLEQIDLARGLRTPLLPAAAFADLPPTTALAFGHGDVVLLGGGDGTVRCLDRDGNLTTPFVGTSRVTALCVAPVPPEGGAASFASGHADGSVRLWGASGTLLWERVVHGHEVWGVALHGDEVVSSGLDQELVRTRVLDGFERERTALENGPLRALAVDRRGRIATGGWVRVDLFEDDGHGVRSLPLGESVRGLAWAGPDRLLSLHSGRLAVWDTGPGVGSLVLDDLEGWVAVEVDDRRRLHLADRSGALRTLQLPSAVHLGTQRFEEPVGALVAVPGGDELVVRVGATARVVDAADGTTRLSVPSGGGRSAQRLAVDPTGRLLVATTGADRPYSVWSLEDGARLAQLGRSGEEAVGVACSPGGDRIATVTRAGVPPRQRHWISCWDLAGRELWRRGSNPSRREVPGPVDGPGPRSRAPWKVAFACDGARLATSEWGRTPEVFAAEDGHSLGLLEAHPSFAWDVAWHPQDPDLLATAADDGKVRLFDARTRTNLATFEAAPALRLRMLQFGPAGELLAACGPDGGAVVFDLSAFDRHVARGALERLEEAEPAAAAVLERWARDVLARPRPRLGR